MDRDLQLETEKLTRSWMQHEASWLRDYLVAGVEDPRLNLQSILSRHFLIQAVAGDRFQEVMEWEYRFAAVLGWLRQAVAAPAGDEEAHALLHALRCGADNAEGMLIPGFVRTCFHSLPATLQGVQVPHFIAEFLEPSGEPPILERCLSTFCHLWRAVLEREFRLPPGEPGQPPASAGRRISVLEPACGSANDYRFLEASGIARLVDYTGLDLCAKNVENARALFPHTRFEEGNVFKLAVSDKSFDYCVVHDLFEHLSLTGMTNAVAEVCRVTQRGLCIGFFQMDETAEHLVRPTEDYYWNLLSLARMKELFASHGFEGQAIHIGSFLRYKLGDATTHNPQAYTLRLSAVVG
jgi:SAM-dependent methyltransferase